jgi:hypothetical protein
MLRCPLMYEIFRLAAYQNVEMRTSYIGRGCNTSNGLQVLIKVSRNSIKAAQEDSDRLVIQMDGRPVFFVMIIYSV